MSELVTTAVQAAGCTSVVIGLGHIGFGRLFAWGPDLERIPTVTARVFMTFHVGLILLLTGLGGLTLCYARDLATQPGLPRAFCSALAALWLWRLVWQVWYFRPSVVGRPSRRQWALHGLLIVAFVVLAAGYAAPVIALG